MCVCGGGDGGVACVNSASDLWKLCTVALSCQFALYVFMHVFPIAHRVVSGRPADVRHGRVV